MKRKWLVFILIIAFAAIFLYLQNNWISLTRLEVASGKLPGNFEGFRIVQISDLHSKSFGSGQERLIKVIGGVKPDIIVITGDTFDSRHYDENASLTLIRKASKIAPVYFVTGNHEWWTGIFPSLENKIRDAGAIILQNVSQKITVGDQSIYLTGLDDPESTGRSNSEYQFIKEKLLETIPQLPEDGFKVLLSHRPESFYLYNKYGVDLVFSGHAHGGQFRLPFAGGLYAPDQGFFPKYTSGIYREGNTAMAVSRGLGNSQIPQRLFNRPDVVLVTLHTSAGQTVRSNGSEAVNLEADTLASDVKAEGTLKGVNAELGRSSKASLETEPMLIDEDERTVQERILVPAGYERVKLADGSFGRYLRELPLKPHGSKVQYYNGESKPSEVYEAVLDMDIGTRDLQQCADSIIRLRAEYLYGKGRFDEISFNFTNGFKADYSRWMKGDRIKVSGNTVSWVGRGASSNDYSSFRKYLDIVFAYAGTLSLSKQMKTVPVEEMQPGDVFIHGDTPGHCEIVLDMAVNETTGEKRFLLAQGYMPAQDMHILKNPANGDGNPWYDTNFGDSLITPEWEFSGDQLMRFLEYARN